MFADNIEEGVFPVRSDGIPTEGVRDQYADGIFPFIVNYVLYNIFLIIGKAAKVWKIFIGDQNKRTENYRKFLVDLLKKNGCKRILDVACGTG